MVSYRILSSLPFLLSVHGLPFFGTALLVIAWSDSASAAIISAPDPGRHDRFLPNGDPNPGFLIDQSLITGLAIERAVLITPMHYITAVHAGSTMPTFLSSDGTLRTYQSAGSVPLTTNHSDGSMVASDVALHTLTAPIPVSDGVSPIAIIDGDINDLIGHEFFVVGANNRTGRNVIDGLNIIQFDDGTDDTFAIRYSYDTATNGGIGGLGADEAGLLGGDSGNPALIQIGGQIGLIGAHFGISVPEGSSAPAGDRYDSFTSVLPPYLAELQGRVSADGQMFQTLPISAVPEPSSTWIGMLTAACWMLRRKRRI